MSLLPEDNATTGYGDLPYVLSGLQRRKNPYDQRRQMAYSMLQTGMDTSPVAHPMQGAARLAQALAGTLMMGKVDSDEAAADKQRQDAYAAAMDKMQTDPQAGLAMLGKVDPEQGVRLAGQLAMQKVKREEDARAFQNGGAQIAAGYGMAPSGGPTGPQQAAMPPEQAKATAQQYVQYLVQNHGFKPEEAAQMVGNLYQESGFNPTALHDNNTGFGMGGWRLDRRDALLKSAQEQGRDPRDPQFQLDFYANELKSRPEFAKFRAAQTPEQRQLALMDYYRPAGWTPQTPQNGHGFGARLQYGQTFAGGGAPQGQLPVPQPPGAAPQGAPAQQGMQPPAVPEVPRPQPTPDLLGRAQQMYSSGMFGKDPQAAVAGARQWVEQQLENQWTRDREAANLRYQQQYGDFKDQRTQADKAADEERKRVLPTQAEMQKFRDAKAEVQTIKSALDTYNTEMDKPGGKSTSLFGVTTPKNTAYNNAALLLKGEALYNLGVLSGPDLGIIRRTLADPSTFAGMYTKREDRVAAVEQIKTLLDTRIAQKERAMGLAPPEGGQAGGGAAPAAAPPADPAAALPPGFKVVR